MTITIAAQWQLIVQVRPAPRVAREPVRARRRAWFPGIGAEELAARLAARQLLADERWQAERNLLFLQRRNGS